MTTAIAVVIAVHNAGTYISATLESVLAQTCDDFQIIVVDDGSTDNTVFLVEQFSDPRIHLMKRRNGGVSSARNIGLEKVDAHAVVFLDGDDLLEPEALAVMIAGLEASPRAIACFGQHLKIDAFGSPLTSMDEALTKPLPRSDTLWHLLAKNVVVNGGAIAIRTGAARAVGGYDSTLAIAEDWEFWCRLASQGDFIALPQHLLLRYRRLPSGADFKERGNILRPHYAAVDKVYSNPAIAGQFSSKVLGERRRKLEIDLHWSAARNLLQGGQFMAFAASAALGLLRYPDSLFQGAYWGRFFKQLVPLGTAHTPASGNTTGK